MNYFKSEVGNILYLIRKTFGLRLKAAIIWVKFKFWLLNKAGIFSIELGLAKPEGACLRCDGNMIGFRRAFYENLVTRNSSPIPAKPNSPSPEAFEQAEMILEDHKQIRLDRCYHILATKMGLAS